MSGNCLAVVGKYIDILVTTWATYKLERLTWRPAYYFGRKVIRAMAWNVL